jgi:glycosyltransferase involved in cell wall biosynthesis
MNNPVISVILPVYNCEKYIAEALDSILNQTFTDFEIFIIDDASTDRTIEIVSGYKDARIQHIRKPKNTGYTDSLNMGIRLTKGKYVARMDGDDISLPERFEMQFKLMESRPEIILCGTWLEIIGTGRIIKNPEHHEQILSQLLLKNPIGHPSVFIRKEAINSFEYDKSKEPAEDYDLWSRMIWEGEFYNIQHPLLLYRQHELQVSHTKSNRQLRHFNESRLQLFKRLGFDASVFSEMLLMKILLHEFSLSAAEFKLMLKWFKEIKKINKIREVFNVNDFNDTAEQIKLSFLKGFFLANKFKRNNIVVIFNLSPTLMYFVFKVYANYISRKFKRKLGISN